MAKLNSKQAAFAENKAAGLTNKDAAIAAGYAQKAAQQTATKLMQHPGIKAAIKAATKTTPGGDAPTMPKASYSDPLDFLADVMNHPQLPIAMRADAAFKMLPYKHARIGEVGKKQTKKDNAAAIARGRHKFATKAPPPSNVVPIRTE